MTKKTVLQQVIIAGCGLGAGALAVLMVFGEDRGPVIGPSLSYARIDGDAKFEAVPQVGLSPTEARRPATYLVWSQRGYSGNVDSEAIDTVVNLGQAESLEHRLNQIHKRKLRADLAEFDQALKDIAALVHEEGQEVKRRLRKRPGSTIVLTVPREKDVNYVKLVAARAEIESSREGVVWGEPLKVGKSEIHFKVLWAEWPELRNMTDEQNHMIRRRRTKVRHWIERQYSQHGMALFADSDRPEE